MLVHHIGIIVKDISKSIEIYRKLGYFQLTDVMVDDVQHNKVVFLQTNKQEFSIELIEAIDKESSIYNFKSGYHHICYDVSAVDEFETVFKSMKIGKIFSTAMIAPAINDRNVTFALLNDGSFVEFLLN